MADGNVTIIKKKKVSGGGGHHGGAWKVAYADFVTAMMAFFLLMWLLNATTEKQRKGLADYFSPTLPIHKTSGGGSGPLGGESVFAEVIMPQQGRGATDDFPSTEKQSNDDSASPAEDQQIDGEETSAAEGSSRTIEDEEFELLEGLLSANTGESESEDPLLQHIRTRVTDEGLIIQLVDQPDKPLFERNSDTPTSRMNELLNVIGSVIGTVQNSVALVGHAFEEVTETNSNINWQLSSNRAHNVRNILSHGGFSIDRISRVTGQADREPLTEIRSDPENNRIEIILLR